MASDRFNVNTSLSKNFEHVNTKFVGSGHPDLTRHEWASAHHRDTNATVLGHYDMLLYASTAEGAATGRTRFSLLQKMVNPVGPPPAAAPAAALAKAVLTQNAAKEGGGGGGAQ